MYSFIHWDVIDEHFSAYRDICEGGWFIKIVVLSAAKWSDRLLKWSHRNLHCYRQADNLKLEIRRFNHTIGEAILCLMSRLPTKDAMMFTSPLLCLVIIWFLIHTFNVGRRIVDHSRVPVAQYVDDFDVFYFAEDDMILTYGLLTAW